MSVGNENSLHDERGFTLADIGINYTQSHRWQLIAGIPDDIFEEYIATTVAETELTSAGVLRYQNGSTATGYKRH